MGAVVCLDYLIQTVIPEPFVATTRAMDPDTEEWGDVEVEVSGFAIVKPNNSLKKLLAAERPNNYMRSK